MAHDFVTNRHRFLTLGSVDLAVRSKRVITVVNTSNSNGSALVGVLNYLSCTASNDCGVGNLRAQRLSSRTLTRLHHSCFNFVFRHCRLLPRLDTVRGIRVPTVCTNATRIGHRNHTESLLTQLKLSKRLARQPDRLSNKRRRHIDVTHTLVGNNRIVLTSRPANTLSAADNGRIVHVLLRLRTTKRAIVLIARSPGITTGTRQVVRIDSNRVLDSQHGRHTRRPLSARPSAALGPGNAQQLITDLNLFGRTFGVT